MEGGKLTVYLSRLKVTPTTHFCPVIAWAAKDSLLSLGDQLKNKKVSFS